MYYELDYTMNNYITQLIIALTIILVIGAVVLFSVINNDKRAKIINSAKRAKIREEELLKEQEKLKNLKEQYLYSLSMNSKKVALEHGREYYRYLRNGSLTVYDEIAIANDLSTMKS